MLTHVSRWLKLWKNLKKTTKEKLKIICNSKSRWRGLAIQTAQLYGKFLWIKSLQTSITCRQMPYSFRRKSLSFAYIKKLHLFSSILSPVFENNALLKFFQPFYSSAEMVPEFPKFWQQILLNFVKQPWLYLLVSMFNWYIQVVSSRLDNGVLKGSVSKDFTI